MGRFSAGVMCLLCFVAWAQTSRVFVAGGLAYKINDDQTSVRVTQYFTQSSMGISSNYMGLTHATIPNVVSNQGKEYVVNGIDEYCFYGYPSYLQEAVIGDSVTHIGKGAFTSCSELTTVTIGKSVASIENQTFEGCTKLKSIVIPNAVKAIKSSAFASCSALTSVEFGNSVGSIGSYAFELCSSLTEVVLPNSVTTIEWGAFADCAALASVTLPASVRNLEQGLFYGDNNLKDIFCHITNPQEVEMSSGVFNGMPTGTCVLHVPRGTKELYQMLPQWKDFANIVDDVEVVITPDDMVMLDVTEAALTVGQTLQLTATTYPAELAVERPGRRHGRCRWHGACPARRRGHHHRHGWPGERPVPRDGNQAGLQHRCQRRWRDRHQRRQPGHQHHARTVSGLTTYT